VERFHRSLKTALKFHADQHWTEALPLVLLEIRTSSQVDLQASVAELVYGETLWIPGELLTPTTQPMDPAHLITQLRQHMARIRPVPATRHASSSTVAHKDLIKRAHTYTQLVGPSSLLTAVPTGSCLGKTKS
jgi:cleavage and polyadenylation specificity factor subunit 1